MLMLFQQALIKNKDRKVNLILYNLRVHHSKVVKEWLIGKEAKLELFYLPSYSPEKNPDKYLIIKTFM